MPRVSALRREFAALRSSRIVRKRLRNDDDGYPGGANRHLALA
jgi:hypothetical protein